MCVCVWVCVCVGSAISSGLFVPMMMIGAVIGRFIGLATVDIAQGAGKRWSPGEGSQAHTLTHTGLLSCLPLNRSTSHTSGRPSSQGLSHGATCMHPRAFLLCEGCRGILG